MSTQAAPQRAKRTPMSKMDGAIDHVVPTPAAPPAPAPQPVLASAASAQMRSGTATMSYDDPELAALLERGRGDEYVPFGAMQQSMVREKKPGWHYHWFNDTPGRTKRALEAGYQHVSDEHGKPVSMVVGVKEGGGDLTAFYMRIPQEWFEADQKPIQDHLRGIEDGMRSGKAGRADQTRYVPQWAPIKIDSKLQSS